MGDTMSDFEGAHNNATKLEQAMNRERVNMMNGLKNGSECDWYTIKIKYAGLSAERKKEDDKILAILGELDDKYADITENSNVSVSSVSEEQEMNSLYNESIPISEDDFIQRSASRVSVKVEPEPTPEPQVRSVPVPVLPKVQPKRITIRPKKRPTSDKKVVVSVKYNTGYNMAAKVSMCSPGSRIKVNRSMPRRLCIAERRRTETRSCLNNIW